MQNRLVRGGNSLRYKIDDLASTAGENDLPAVEMGAKQVAGQFLAATTLVSTFVINFDRSVSDSALARLKFVENSLHAVSADDADIVARQRHRPAVEQIVVRPRGIEIQLVNLFQIGTVDRV